MIDSRARDRVSARMAKTKIQFLCNACGSVHPKWMGKCPDCGTWDALQEYKAPTEDRPPPVLKPADGDITRGAEAVAVADISDSDIPRFPTGIGEFDRILGGGVVPG